MKTLRKIIVLLLICTAAGVATLMAMGRRDGTMVPITIYWMLVLVKLVLDELEG